MSTLKLFGSLWFAVALMAGLLVMLIVSTSMESAYGTPFAQKFFYQAGWFDVFLALLSVNIFCSALTRWPFKKNHTGFVTTHVGILILLSGALLSRLAGAEGQVLLYENDRSDSMLLSDYKLVVHAHGRGHQSLSLGKTKLGRSVPLRSAGPDYRLSVDQFYEEALPSVEVAASKGAQEENPAVQLKIQSQTLGFDDHFWLVEKNPWGARSSEVSLGPAAFRLMRKTARDPDPKKTDAPFVEILLGPEKKSWVIPLDELLKKKSAAFQGFQITDFLYFPDARVGAENGLQSVSESARNPAVRFDLTDPEGHKKRFVLFAFFPDFESMHEKKADPSVEASARFRFDNPSAEPASKTPSLTIFFGEDGWSYRSVSSKSKSEGALSAGQTLPTGWMDFQFTAKELLTNAAVERRAKKNSGGEPAAKITVFKKGEPLFSNWVFSSAPSSTDLPGGPLAFSLERQTQTLPFALRLDDFRKVDYPGTSKPMSFESDVTLSDKKEKLIIQKTISMNRPLDHRGFRIFQSSYIQDPDSGREASVFTVAKNPGIVFIYGGAIVLFTGAILVFFVPPFSSIKGD